MMIAQAEQEFSQPAPQQRSKPALLHTPLSHKPPLASNKQAQLRHYLNGQMHMRSPSYAGGMIERSMHESDPRF